MDRNTEQLAADRERLVASMRRRIQAFLQAGNFPLNDPAFTSQLAEMWAIRRGRTATTAASSRTRRSRA